jgi:FKBP12-rapamycin complex-associated protein
LTFWQENTRKILNAYHMATTLDPSWYKAWHTWALANFEVVSHLEAGPRGDDIISEIMITHVIAAIQGDRSS